MSLLSENKEGESINPASCYSVKEVEGGVVEEEKIQEGGKTEKVSRRWLISLQR